MAWVSSQGTVVLPEYQLVGLESSLLVPLPSHGHHHHHHHYHHYHQYHQYLLESPGRLTDILFILITSASSFDNVLVCVSLRMAFELPQGGSMSGASVCFSAWILGLLHNYWGKSLVE